ncbi:3',5'-cyclic-nucleotide phosphodiesterase [Capronia epimyces CBS 606.96]|uniref:Phosphodiesterase n=1 Tax=Capronia epimyces CBS 606.96 TaxID=1182542 RepID=W9XQI1_9EURO|nr:3',5'-cyclic-nucleotide phosphodiesterase [Capronia epimyces CBS 606.96]EXJ79585.1 3',5'-cyclic-nucleotide phosphodiesterase [Capronia epimyces CBS 606.96]
MDPAACRVVYIDERFDTERWISREALSPGSSHRRGSQFDFSDLPADLQSNISAFLSVFNQVYVCTSGRAFSAKLSELHDQVKVDCTPILACFDVGSEAKHDHLKPNTRFSPSADSPLPSPTLLRREFTFSSESDESYGLQLLSRIASDLQVDEGVKLIIPVAIVQPRRKDSHDQALDRVRPREVLRAPYSPESESESEAIAIDDSSDIIDAQLMLQCLDAGALDVVRSPLDKAGIMGLTVHAYRIYKDAKKEQKGFMAMVRRTRKQSWVGMDEEKPYAHLREAMVKKLLKGICEPQNVIEDYQHRDLYVEEARKEVIAQAIASWGFCGHDFTEDELVYAGYFMLDHALQVDAVEKWRMSQAELLHFMQGCRVAYNSFVLYHNFRHAVDVLQSVFHFLVQVGALPPYPAGAKPPPFAGKTSPVARLLGPFEALTLLIAAIGHDVGHPGVNNMFLVKLNAPLAQLYNDQSVLEAFHCAAYSQILRRHWPAAFQDKALRKLMISTILATDMGIHSDYMQQLGNLQEKIHETQATDGWAPKDVEWARALTCALLIKCADISNVARPWAVAEKWTFLLQEEFAHQGQMEQAVGMETALFGGPPELGNMLKLANGQIGFMTIFAHPLFSNVADIVPAMRFAADEILTNKGVWITRAEHEKRVQVLQQGVRPGEGGSVSPRTLSPIGRRGTADNGRDRHGQLTSSPLRDRADSPGEVQKASHPTRGPRNGHATPLDGSQPSSSPVETETTLRPDDPAARGTPITTGTNTNRTPLEVWRGSSSTGADTGHLSRDHGFGSPPGAENNEPTTTNTPTLSSSDDQMSSGVVQALPDNRRDNATSMRAGSEAIPAEALNTGKGEVSDAEALAKFDFATSKEDESVRTYVPLQPRPADHASASASASAPTSGLDLERAQNPTPEEFQQTRSALSERTTSTTLRGGIEEIALTPSQSTEATSYTSEKSVDLARNQGDFQATRNRAASAPIRQSAPTELSPSFSKGSNSAGSGESSKVDVHATILSNGDMEEGRPRDRKDISKTIGRRRSRLKLGLAFWKRNRTEKNVEEGDRPGSPGSSCG